MACDSLERLGGTYASPLPRPPLPACPAVEDIGTAQLAALAAPCDFLALEKVAAVVKERYADVVWIRLDDADEDPGALLVTLLGAAARLNAPESAAVGEAATRGARRGDWGTAYRLVARLFAAVAARPAILVLEGAEHLDRGASATLNLLVSAFLPPLYGELSILLIGFADWPSQRLSPHGAVLGRSALRLHRHTAAVLAEAFHLDLPSGTLDRSLALTHGAAGAMKAVFSAGVLLGPDALRAVAGGATSGAELLQVLGRNLLAQADEDMLVALAGAIRIGTWHPIMGIALGHEAIQRREPWWLDLAEGWLQLIPAWRAPLRAVGCPSVLGRASLALLADNVASQGAEDRALDLYVAAGEIDRAADIAVDIASELARAGCWATLARLGQVFGPDMLTAEPMPERRHSRPATWWSRLFARRGHRPAGRPLDAVSQAVDVATQPGTAAISPLMLETAPAITAHLLGELRVAVGDRLVETWVSRRGRAVFEYLLTHRHGKVRRDRLMSVFWPEASANAARNSLNVAIYGLRQSLRLVAGDRAIVVYQDHCYFIEPAFDVWVDVEVFEQRLKSANQHLASGEVLQAEADFEAAICIYQGEFLADDPYEEWAAVTREHLRLCHLDALDQVGRLRLDSGDYTGCVSVCLKILACDNCREDAHRRLMRCYSRHGQPELALRQYHSCAAALREELGVSPALATTELFNRIRCRDEV
jgi:DNA-binding SARP family transcriptional activator